ncbi:PREDICTED: mitochondrial import receptor subunit TOM70-like [Priapulus caudatus]|uniref:Mitochondrial import receptor subunit TOM70-like n=1 Tax=Priapulus caudatus TaxID=37621 RepID=A0ABM1FA89_PRICU|nr:PREDICTED: mitochondrial import receptor subunit TOM70-like [Priapulus caudatus]
MATSTRNVTDNTGWPKWQIAVAVGVGALGVGTIYYLYRRNNKQKAKTCEVVENVEPKTQDPTEKAQAAKNKGNVFFKSGRFDKAIDCYTSAISVCPKENKSELATFYQNRAAAFEQLKNYAKVIEDCNNAVELNGKYTKALFRRAKASEQLNSLPQCLEDITAVCILEDFQNHNSLVMADRVLKELGKQRAKEAFKNRTPVMPSQQFIKSYFSAFAEDPVFNSIKAEENEKDRDESDEVSGYEKAKQLLRGHQYEHIIDECSAELARADSQHRPEALLLRATFYLLLGQSDKAMKDFNELMAIDGASDRVKTNALIKRGSLKMQQGDQDGALSDFALAGEIDSVNSDVYHHRGQLNLLMDKCKEALSDFNMCVELKGDFPVAHVQMCYTKYRYALMTKTPHKVEEAMKDFNEVLVRFPTCAEGFALYGQALYDQNDFGKADDYFKKALDIEPENANVYVHRGLLMLQWKQDIEAAAKLINKALEIDDRCEFAYETLGTIEVQRSHMENAISLFEKAIWLAKTEVELAHLYSLYEAAKAQQSIARKLGIAMPSL